MLVILYLFVLSDFRSVFPKLHQIPVYQGRITVSQPPSYIMITAQKSSEMFTHKPPLGVLTGIDGSSSVTFKPRANAGGADIAHGDVHETYAEDNAATYAMGAQNYVQTKIGGRYIAQNQDSNLSILRMSILVQSSVGSMKFSGDTFPYLRDQAIIFNEHKRNCNSDYILDGTVGDWSKRCCCVLLNVSQYLHGLGSSAGVACPIQISAEVEFANRCRFIDGSYAYDKKFTRGPMMHEDMIRARPVFVGLFDKQVVQIASSSAVLSAQNLSQDSATQILASRS